MCRRASFRLKNWSHYKATMLKHKAEASGIEFSMESSDIPVPKKCPILGIPLRFVGVGEEGAQFQKDTPSVDRMDSKLGYVRGNVWVISKQANMMKQDADWNTLLRFARWVIRENRKRKGR